MKRTPLDERKLPDYTTGEEIFNMTSHIVGAVMGLVVLVLGVVFAALHGNARGMIGGAVYGTSMIFLYTMSAVYHGLGMRLTHPHAKRVLQVLDHCTIYALIAGSYVPILLTGLWDEAPLTTILLACVVLVGTAVGVTFTAIDHHRFRVISNACYFVIGWSVIFALPVLLRAFPHAFFYWILAGGLAFTLGTVFYVTGIRKRYHHSIFHLFIVLGTALQAVGILMYCM